MTMGIEAVIWRGTRDVLPVQPRPWDKVMPSNHAYQAEIARTLVADGGLREALDLCTKNDWQGVFQAILKLHGLDSAANHNPIRPH